MPRVLIVDDEPEIVTLLQEFLTLKGYTVYSAGDGREALRVVKAERPHVVLLDIRMPKMNGLETLRQIREIDREIAVVMVTGINEEATGQAALKLGACDYLRKPLDLRYLERCLWHMTTEMTL